MKSYFKLNGITWKMYARACIEHAPAERSCSDCKNVCHRPWIAAWGGGGHSRRLHQRVRGKGQHWGQTVSLISSWMKARTSLKELMFRVNVVSNALLPGVREIFGRLTERACGPGGMRSSFHAVVLEGCADELLHGGMKPFKPS